jgi:hypothetical protein
LTREFHLYCAVSPSGQPIRAAIGQTPDEAWQSLLAQITEPDTLHEKGWRIGMVRCVLMDLIEEEPKAPRKRGPGQPFYIRPKTTASR